MFRSGTKPEPGPCLAAFTERIPYHRGKSLLNLPLAMAGDAHLDHLSVAQFQTDARRVLQLSKLLNGYEGRANCHDASIIRSIRPNWTTAKSTQSVMVAR